MPIYEYACGKCGHQFEKIQKFSDPLIDTCPKCGGAVHKLQSAPAFQFKGSGWYITDYARKDQSASKGEKGEKGDKAAGEGAKTDSTTSGTKESAPKSDKASETKKPATKTDA